MSEIEEFDEIVLGGGKGGKSLALALASAGHKVALVEAGMIGGSCINVACIPTKTMVSGSKLVAEARQASRDGFSVAVKDPNLTATLKRKRHVVETMVSTHWDLFTRTSNLHFILGEGRFIAQRTIEVDTRDGKRIIKGDRVFINTGTRPLIPSYPGLDSVGYLTSTSIMELEVLPDHLLILGGGYIALEFAQIFLRLGSKVTLIERSNRFLPREEPEIAQSIKEILNDEGLSIKFETKIEAISRKGAEITVDALEGGSPVKITGSHILVATGRESNYDRLNLEAAGVAFDERGFIKVNEKLETSAPDVYALGDCKGPPFFTHVSWDDFRIVRDNLLNGASRTTQDRLVPYTLFVEPELGRVGLTEAEARAKGYEVLTATLPASKIPRANTSGETRGLLKAVVDKKTKAILGASILCASGGEVVSCLQVAMLAGMPCTTLKNTVFSHPTMAESLNLLFAGVN